MGIDIGSGTTITFGTSAWDAQVLSINHGGVENASIPSSHLGTSIWHTFLKGDLTDPGELEIEYQADTTSLATTGTKIPPILDAAETITITFPAVTGGGTAKVAGTGFVTSASPFTFPLEELIVGSMTIKFSGALTFTDAT